MTEASQPGGFRVLCTFTAVMMAGWVICFWPAKLLRGESGVWWMSLAAIAALVPGWIIVFLSGLAILRNPLHSMLVQTSVRLLIVAATAITVRIVRPDVGLMDFFGWLIGFYLLALTIETRLLRQSFVSPLRK